MLKCFKSDALVFLVIKITILGMVLSEGDDKKPPDSTATGLQNNGPSDSKDKVETSTDNKPLTDEDKYRRNLGFYMTERISSTSSHPIFGSPPQNSVEAMIKRLNNWGANRLPSESSSLGTRPDRFSSPPAGRYDYLSSPNRKRRLIFGNPSNFDSSDDDFGMPSLSSSLPPWRRNSGSQIVPGISRRPGFTSGSGGDVDDLLGHLINGAGDTGPPQFKPLNAFSNGRPLRRISLESTPPPSTPPDESYPGIIPGRRRLNILSSPPEPSENSFGGKPGRLKPLDSLPKPPAPHDDNASVKPGLFRPGQKQTGWFKLDPDGNLMVAPEGEGFQGTFSQIPLPGSSEPESSAPGSSIPGSPSPASPSPGSSAPPGPDARDPHRMTLGHGPVTPSGKRVGRSKGLVKRIIDGQELIFEEWELTGRDMAEMEAKPQGDVKMLGKFSTDPANPSQLSTYEGPTKSVELFSFYESAYKNRWNDPMWNLQWYMHDYRTKDMPVMDMNVVPAWDMGYTGKGVKVAVVDDGVMHGHPDLAPNHLVGMSFDYSKDIPGSQPDEPLMEHSHGTKCASEIAMVAGNGLCGVGMAYNAKIIGVKKALNRMALAFKLVQPLVHKLQDIDVSSNSYGPNDDGIDMKRAPEITYKAFSKGVTEGRGGKGTVYVFPAGNGKEDGDHCGADALMNNRYTIGISSATQRGKPAPYSERCASIMASVYSSGGKKDEGVVTVEMDNNCFDRFGGTSAAVPHASAVIALVLEARRDLTYRDVMHIITMGAEVAPLADNANSWHRNGAGFWVSNDFGFGLMNAKNMVTLAKRWRNVPVQHNSCTVNFNVGVPVTLSTGNTASVETYVNGCPGINSVKWIENVELDISIIYGYRGALSVTLTSPQGTISQLLETRRKDNMNEMQNWVFRTVHHWGENPNGRWVIQVTANALDGLPALTGSIYDAAITFHGMPRDPPHQSQLPRKYSAFRLPDGLTSQEKRLFL